jgi:predicted metal-dependent HD superfamily phosphohydrolase
MCTKHHFINIEYDDSDLNYFLDFDLETFGLDDFESYMEINSGIQYEFTHHYNLEDFKNGRVKFLNFALTKNSIYRTDEYKNNFEKKARENIQKEIEIYSK